jgi:hypothetical protein
MRAPDLSHGLRAACRQLVALLCRTACAEQVPLFLLHCGAVFDGEQDDWDTEPNSGAAVDALAAKHPGETLGLFAAPVGEKP